MVHENFFRYSAIPQLVIDPYQDAVLAANREVCLLLGISEEQVRAQPASRLFASSLPDLVVFTEQVMEQGHAWNDHLSLTGPDQDQRVEVSGYWRDKGKSRFLSLSLQRTDELDKLRVMSDARRHHLSGIGHWNRVNQAFKEFEHQNRLLLDAAGEGIYGVDAHGMTTFVNPAAERILGYTAEELAGTNMHQIIHHSRSDGSHFFVENCPIFEAFRDGAVHTVEDDVFWSKDGRKIDVEYTSTPIRDNDFIIGAVVIFRDVSQKKADHQKLLEALTEVEKLKNRLELENAYLMEEINSEFNHHQIVGNSPAVQNIVHQIELVAASSATVLIHGESGTGKELIARAIHDMSERSSRSLIRVNCAAIPENLFESEFFGHARGAFTGATSERPGRFELADGGTLFLDEVSEIPLHLQGKLLRVLQEHQFERVGESRTRKVNVRILAATNRDLKQCVASGSFREDLYFRLNVFPIESPPLRKRLPDIPLLTSHFLEKACKRANRPVLKVSMNEIRKLENYPWPGNIRELENIIEREVIRARGDSIHFRDLHERPQKGISAYAQEAVITDAERKNTDRANLLLALKKCRGKIFGPGGVAELLEMKPTTVASRLQKYRIDPAQFKAGKTAAAGQDVH